jgi:aryl sulfotransferase
MGFGFNGQHSPLPIRKNRATFPHMTDHPQRTRTYLGPYTDSSRWDALDIRATDVFICTPPKCGTTWSQGIAVMMIHGSDFQGNVGKISPWLDSQTRSMDEVIKTLDNQTHRRCIKTHTPLDGIVYDPRATYIAIYRHPLDVHFSMRNHAANMTNDKLDHLFTADPRSDALRFIDDHPPATDCDHLTLETFISHYKSFKKYKNLDNVHLFHYADMRADLPSSIARFADILGYDFNSETMAALIKGASFGEMRKKSEQFTPSAGMGVFKDEAAFFKSASSGKWQKHLTDADMARYGARMDQLLGARDRHWLENGSTE